VRFKLSSLYPLNGFAMVNVRDLAGVVNAWKLLISPDPRQVRHSSPPSPQHPPTHVGNSLGIKLQGANRITNVQSDMEEFESGPEYGSPHGA
jgi:hypothetical protein